MDTNSSSNTDGCLLRASARDEPSLTAVRTSPTIDLSLGFSICSNSALSALGQGDAGAQQRGQLARERGHLVAPDAAEELAEIDVAAERALAGGLDLLAALGELERGDDDALLAHQLAQDLGRVGVAHAAHGLAARADPL